MNRVYSNKVWAFTWCKKGQAMTEYVLLIGMFLGIIAVGNGPVPIFPMLLDAFQRYLDGMYLVINLPIP